MTPLDPIARAQGAMSALQSTIGELVAETAEAEARAREAEQHVHELHHKLGRVEREAYRRGYITGHHAARRGRPADPGRAMRDTRNTNRHAA